MVQRFGFRIPLFALLVSLTACRSTSDTASRSIDDGNGAYATGRYRNLFAEAGHSQKEIRAKIDGAFQQLFHGDPTNQTVYYEHGSNSNGLLALITDIKHRDVRTAAFSY